MSNITPLGQRWSQWASVQLGTSNTTIGSHGCTITCLTMLLNFFGYEETPVTVNKRLKDNKGYLNGNLIIWTAIPKIWDRMKFEWRGYGYDNNQVSNNLPCLVEVDFDGTERTDDRHWVLFKGDKKMNDPWTGTERSTSDYPILTGYAVITGKQGGAQPPTGGNDMADMYKGIDLNNKESVKVAVDLWADVVQNGKVIITKTEVENLQKSVSRVKELEKELSDTKKDCDQKLAQKDIVFNELKEKYDQLVLVVDPLKTKLEELATINTKLGGQLDMIKRVGYKSFAIPTEAWDEEKTILSHLTALSSSGNPENWTTSQLIGLIWQRLMRSLDRSSK